jgi:hypothetical protein
MRAASGKRRGTDHLIAGLIPKVRGVTDPDMARAMAERHDAMEMRACALAQQAIEARHDWVHGLGSAPDDPGDRACWLRDVSTIAAYRDRWHITGPGSLGGRDRAKSIEQVGQLQRALAATQRARAIGRAAGATQTSSSHDIEVDTVRGVDL